LEHWSTIVAEKKYQIFISSTFSDLIEERQLALKAILDLDHIPAGMEAFPAIDMDQFEYIKKVIDECDYYLLIIGARYGSTDADGVSYTEREFDYARSIGKTVIALLHNDIENLPMKNFDTDPSLKIKLDEFREKVKTGRMVRFWNNRDQLIAAMMQAIMKAINTYPAVGWIRGDAAAADDIMQKFLQLRTAYDELVKENSNKLDGLSSLDEDFTIKYRYMSGGSPRNGELTRSWGDLLKIVGPDLFSPTGPKAIARNIKQYIHEQHAGRSNLELNNMDIDTVKIHFAAVGILSIRPAKSISGGVVEFVHLTDKGNSELLKRMAVRSKEVTNI
jgi:hypothetical protein